MPDQLTDAYVAGLIDGEGCLWVQSKSDRWFTPRCDMGMSEKAKPVLEKLMAQYGGSMNKQRDATAKWEAAWRWVLSGKDCRSMLERVQPYLVLKSERGRLLLSLTNESGRTIKELVSELNRKGPSETHADGWFARHVGGAWLTPQRSLLNPHGWAEFSGTWPTSGVMRNGRAYPRAPWVRHTHGSACSLLPTPQASDVRNRGTAGSPVVERRKRIGKQQMLSMLFRGAPCPHCVESLMGFPADWTVVEPSATP